MNNAINSTGNSVRSQAPCCGMSKSVTILLNQERWSARSYLPKYYSCRLHISTQVFDIIQVSKQFCQASSEMYDNFAEESDMAFPSGCRTL